MNHYQLSFTTRQALVLFMTLLLALSFAYFLGLMTGLAGRRTESAAAAATPRAAEWREASQPTRSGRSRTMRQRGAPAPAGARLVEPTAPQRLELFQDRAEAEPTPSLGPRIAEPATAAPTEFWVQVMSVSSEREAKSRSRKLILRRYPATVEPAAGPKGTLFRVRVGPYASREQASKAAERLSREEKAKTWVVPPGK